MAFSTYHPAVQPQPRKSRKAWNEAGHAHFVTFSCYRRLPLLNRGRTRGWVMESLDAVRRRLDVALWAYVVMPEHVHVLLRPRRATYEMPRILSSLKRPVATRARAFLLKQNQAEWLARLTVRYPTRTVFRFWQPGGGFDHNIFKEKTVAAVMDYIHANPVRRGLVPRATDWKWSSARFWEGERDVPLLMDHPHDSGFVG